MFDFLKPKKPQSTVQQQSSPSFQPIIPNQTVFEVGKEVMIRDEKSGESIYRMAMSPQHKQLILSTIQKNAGVGQGLLNLAVNLANILRQLEATDKVRMTSEKEIEDTITKVRDEMKIDKRWGLNMQLGVLERREPPE